MAKARAVDGCLEDISLAASAFRVQLAGVFLRLV